MSMFMSSSSRGFSGLLAFAIGCVLHLANVDTIAADVRVLVPLWLTDFGSNTSFDLDATQTEATSFVLAAKHFNERRSDIIPALATVAACTKNLSVVAICDESANSKRVTDIIKEFESEIDIVCGVTSAAASYAATFADVAYGIPHISHWTSANELSNKDRFPYFSRTFISDLVYYEKIAVFLRQMGFDRVNILYVNDDILPQTSKEVQNMLADINIDALTYSFEYQDQATVNSALRRIKESGRTVIIYIGWETDLTDYIAAEAASLGLNATDNLWIFTTTDTLPGNEDFLTNPALMNLMEGSLYFTFGAQNDSLLSNFMELYSTEFANDPNLVSNISAKLPPFGAANEVSGSCKNDALDMSLPNDYFSTIDLTDLPVGFAPGYDAMIAIGLAACSTNSPIVSAQDFTDRIRDVKFLGLSGYVEFDSRGDRSEMGTTFQLYNFRTKPSGDGLDSVLSGVFDSSWNFIEPEKIQLRGGLGLDARPGNYTKPSTDLNHLPRGLIVLGYVEVAFVVLVAMSCIIWTFLNRDEPVIRSSQPLLVALAAVGSIIVAMAILPLTADDDPSNGIQATQTSSCMAIPYLFFIGSQVTLGAIIGKSLRAYVVFERNSRFHHRVHESHVFAFVIVLVAVNIIILINWQYVAPFSWHRVPVVLDRFGQVIESRGECNFSNDSRSIGFLATLAILYALTVLALRFVSTLSRKRFIEERNLSAALLQVFALVVPSVIAAYSFVIGRFVMLSSYFTLCALLSLLFLFVPKFVQIREQRRWKKLVAAIGDRDKESDERSPSNNANDIDILDALRIPMVQAKFERYAEENFVTESYLFILDVLSFKEQFATQTNAWKSDKVNCIMNVYIFSGSLLQINVSERCREGVVSAYKRVLGARANLTDDLFDAPLREVAAMLNHGAWASFVQEGGMFNVRTSLMPRSKVLGWFITPDSELRLGPKPTTSSSLSQDLAFSSRKSGL